MRRLVLLGTVAGLVVVAAPGASAATTGQYVMYTTPAPNTICRFAVTNDTTPGAVFGGPDVWNGAVTIDYVTTISQGMPGTATVSCVVKVDGFEQSTPVLGPVSGTGVVAATGRLTFTAVALVDTVELCAHVTIGSSTTVTCYPSVTMSVDDVANTPIAVLDQVLCGALTTAAPVVNGLGQPTVIRINPTYGDLYVAGFWVYDCPPYGVG